MPPRATDLSTDDPAALSAAQPERGREYLQLGAGPFRARLREQLQGRVGLLAEAWSVALRVRCARPRSYVAFSSVVSDARPTWCGEHLEPDDVLEIASDWEITSRAALGSVSFAVDKDQLERTEAIVTRREPRPRGGNRLLRGGRSPTGARLLRDVVEKALGAGPLLAEARQSLESDLLALAVALRRLEGPELRPESLSRRRAAVRRIGDFLAANPRALPSSIALCQLAGVSERTLEYAFLEELGMTPTRYLRIRRLNAVRQELRGGDLAALTVTDVAMRWGFWELGRFARAYRALFGELPSATLARRRLDRGQREVVS